jgi:hypothetical protein
MSRDFDPLLNLSGYIVFLPAPAAGVFAREAVFIVLYL